MAMANTLAYYDTEEIKAVKVLKYKKQIYLTIPESPL
jgi:hypothetical protein